MPTSPGSTRSAWPRSSLATASDIWSAIQCNSVNSTVQHWTVLLSCRSGAECSLSGAAVLNPSLASYKTEDMGRTCRAASSNQQRTGRRRKILWYTNIERTATTFHTLFNSEFWSFTTKPICSQDRWAGVESNIPLNWPFRQLTNKASIQVIL